MYSVLSCIEVKDSRLGYRSCYLTLFFLKLIFVFASGTTVAAQAAAAALANKALSFSLNDVRVIIKGLGPGRHASIKGLEMTGINIVSITDRTPASERPPRPRKAKRL